MHPLMVRTIGCRLANLKSEMHAQLPAGQFLTTATSAQIVSAKWARFLTQDREASRGQPETALPTPNVWAQRPHGAWRSLLSEWSFSNRGLKFCSIVPDLGQ